MTQAEKTRTQDVEDLRDAIRAQDWMAVRSIATVSKTHNNRKPEWCKALDELLKLAQWAEEGCKRLEENSPKRYAIRSEMLDHLVTVSLAK